jgi:hypothetical protein
MIRRLCAVVTALLIASCGSKPAEKPQKLTFERLDAGDTTGWTQGPALLHTFEITRVPGGALRAKGNLDLPDGTKLELNVYPPTGNTILARTQFEIHGGSFETAPLNGFEGPLPEQTYHFQLRGIFDPAVQPPQVMAALNGGRKLRGPGMVEGPNGLIAYVHDEELRR